MVYKQRQSLQIPTAERQVQEQFTTGVPNMPQVPVDNSEAIISGAIAKGLMGIAEYGQKQAATKEAIDSELQYTRFLTNLNKMDTTLQNQYGDTDPEKYYDEYEQRSRSLRDEMAAGIENSNVRSAFYNNTERALIKSDAGAFNWTVKKQKEVNTVNAVEILANREQLIANSDVYNPASLVNNVNEAKQYHNAVINSDTNLDKEVVTKAYDATINKGVEDYFYKVADTKALWQLETTLQNLDEGEYDSVLDPKQKVKVATLLTTQAERLKAFKLKQEQMTVTEENMNMLAKWINGEPHSKTELNNLKDKVEYKKLLIKLAETTGNKDLAVLDFISRDAASEISEIKADEREARRIAREEAAAKRKEEREAAKAEKLANAMPLRSDQVAWADLYSQLENIKAKADTVGGEAKSATLDPEDLTKYMASIIKYKNNKALNNDDLKKATKDGLKAISTLSAYVFDKDQDSDATPAQRAITSGAGQNVVNLINTTDAIVDQYIPKDKDKTYAANVKGKALITYLSEAAKYQDVVQRLASSDINSPSMINNIHEKNIRNLVFTNMLKDLGQTKDEAKKQLYRDANGQRFGFIFDKEDNIIGVEKK